MSPLPLANKFHESSTLSSSVTVLSPSMPLVAQMVKNSPAMQETEVRSLGREDPLEEGMATHSSILAWRIPQKRSLVGYSPWGCKESDTAEWLTHIGPDIQEVFNQFLLTEWLATWLNECIHFFLLPCPRPGFSIFHLCGRLWNKPTNSSYHMHTPLQRDFALPPIKRWSLFPHPLNPGWPCTLLWLVESSRRVSVWLPRPGLKTSCSFSLHSLRILPAEHHAEKKSRMKDHLERSVTAPVSLAPNQSTNWRPLCEGVQVRSAEELRGQSTES